MLVQIKLSCEPLAVPDEISPNGDTTIPSQSYSIRRPIGVDIDCVDMRCMTMITLTRPGNSVYGLQIKCT